MEFSIKRITLALLRDITIQKSNIITTLAVVSGILFIGLLLMTRSEDRLSADEFLNLFRLCFFILGVLFTFTILKEAHDSKCNNLYFTIPISPLERLAAIWFLTTVGYTLCFTIVAVLVGQGAIFVGALVFGSDFHSISLFTEGYWQLVKGYFIIQPLFLCGAIGFSRNRGGKTFLTLLLLFILLLAFGAVLFSVLNYKHGIDIGDRIANDAFSLASKDFSNIAGWFFAVVFGPVMLLCTYFKLVEKEV